MKTISVAELRQNPGPALAAVARGEEFVVVRYRSEIARLVPPPQPRQPVTAAEVSRVLEDTPVDAEWASEMTSDRVADVGDDPWASQ